jgi:hypothetical protein
MMALIIEKLKGISFGSFVFLLLRNIVQNSLKIKTLSQSFYIIPNISRGEQSPTIERGALA